MIEKTKEQIINNYIIQCDEAIQKNIYLEMKELTQEIISVFNEEIKGLRTELDCCKSYVVVPGQQKKFDYIGDLRKIKAKLTYYLATLGGKVSEKRPSLVVNNYNNNTNVNQNVTDLNLDLLFQTTESIINDMESLSIEETNSVLGKLEELKQISKSKDNRKQKWNKLGNIFKWLADKSVDIAIAFIPVISQVLGIIK